MNTLANTITAILTNIFTSASKLVFLGMAFTLCLAFMYGKISQENFIFIVGNVFSYYFGVAQGSIGAQTPLPPQPPRDPEALSTAAPVSVTKTETTTTAPPTVPGVK